LARHHEGMPVPLAIELHELTGQRQEMKKAPWLDCWNLLPRAPILPRRCRHNGSPFPFR